MTETARTVFTLVVLCFGGGQAPAPHAQVYTYSHGPNSLKFPHNALVRGDDRTDRWQGTYVLLGPNQTGKAGRWEVRSPFFERLVYDTEGWDGTGTREFTTVNKAARAPCAVTARP